MPIPQPTDSESERAFMDRCMSAVAGEFDTNEQAVAVCLNRWRSKEKMSESKEIVWAPLEIKSVDPEQRTFHGLCAGWEVDLQDDVFAPGCFRKSIDEFNNTKSERQRQKRVPLLNRHKSERVHEDVLGHAICLEETEKGLEGDFYVADSRAGEDVWRLIKGGSLDALSVGFMPVRKDYETRPDPVTRKEKRVRVLKEVRLMEVSVVPWGAQPLALIDLASVKEALASPELSDADREALQEAQEAIAARLAAEPAPDPVAEPKADPEAEAEADAEQAKAVPPPIAENEVKLGVLARQRDAAALAGDYDRAEDLAARCRGIELKLKRLRSAYARMLREIEALDADIEASEKGLVAAIADQQFEEAARLKHHLAAAKAVVERKRAEYARESRRPAIWNPDDPDRVRKEAGIDRLALTAAE